MRVIIIGGGVSGLSCALYLSRYGYQVEVFNGYSYGNLTQTPLIQNYPGVQKISGFQLIQNMMKQCEDNGVIIRDQKIVDISSEDKNVVDDLGQIHEYEILVVCTGSQHKKLQILNNYRNVHYCATCDGSLYRNKEVAVIGGGNSALTQALFLSNICKKVYLIHRRDTFRAQKTLVDKVVVRQNIHIMYSSHVEEVFGDQKVEKLRVENDNTGTIIQVDGVFVSIGSKSNDELLKSLEQDYKIQDNCLSGYEDIYVCGDVSSKYKQAIISAGQGAKVAMKIHEKNS